MRTNYEDAHNKARLNRDIKNMNYTMTPCAKLLSLKIVEGDESLEQRRLNTRALLREWKESGLFNIDRLREECTEHGILSLATIEIVFGD